MKKLKINNNNFYFKYLTTIDFKIVKHFRTKLNKEIQNQLSKMREW